MSNTIPVELFFHDDLAIRLAGITAPNPAQVNVFHGAIPTTGDVVRFAGLNYQSGELAIFQVVSRAHVFGGEHTQRIQLNLALVVAHQP